MSIDLLAWDVARAKFKKQLREQVKERGFLIVVNTLHEIVYEQWKSQQIDKDQASEVMKLLDQLGDKFWELEK